MRILSWISILFLGFSSTCQAQTNTNNKKVFKVISVRSKPVITKGDPGTEGNIYGFEGGRVLKANGYYHIFTTEMYGKPIWTATKLAHWKSKDGIYWNRVSTIFKSSGNFDGTDTHAALWSPMPKYDKQNEVWTLTYVCYRSKPNTEEDWYRNYDGHIARAVSQVQGPKGIDGPYKEQKIMMKPDSNSGKWEGLMGVDSFFPYKVAPHQWMAFYGSSPEMNGLASSSNLAGPWQRMHKMNPVSKHTENPVVQKLGDSLLVAFIDGTFKYQNMGYMISKDGIHWLDPIIINLDDNSNRWWGLTRTPLGIIDDGNGIYRLYFTAYNKNFYKIPGIWSAKTDAVFDGFFAGVGMLRIELRDNDPII